MKFPEAMIAGDIGNLISDLSLKFLYLEFFIQIHFF